MNRDKAEWFCLGWMVSTLAVTLAPVVPWAPDRALSAQFVLEWAIAATMPAVLALAAISLSDFAGRKGSGTPGSDHE